MLTGKLEFGDTIPPPGQNVAEVRDIAPDVKTQAALLVRQARGERSMVKLARALEAPRHWPSLRSLDRAVSALGKRLVPTCE
ncbi:MAG: hypothetical protein LBU45_07485 [Azoarcus sp.]|nr:hypothetical protein [Azoarcus sp.]